MNKAVTVKLTRPLAIVPITRGLSLIMAKKSAKEDVKTAKFMIIMENKNKDSNILETMPVGPLFIKMAVVASISILNSVMQFVMLLLPGLVQGAQPISSYNNTK